MSKISDWLGRKTKNIPIENSYLSLLHYLHKYESESAVKFPNLWKKRFSAALKVSVYRSWGQVRVH